MMVVPDKDFASRDIFVSPGGGGNFSPQNIFWRMILWELWIIFVCKMSVTRGGYESLSVSVCVVGEVCVTEVCVCVTVDRETLLFHQCLQKGKAQDCSMFHYVLSM